MKKEFDPRSAHKYCTDNKTYLQAEQKCGCFYCGKIFSSSEIKNWLSAVASGTALCPYCAIDSVIGESSGYDITDDFLLRMNLYWFESGTGSSVRTSFGDVCLMKDSKRCNFNFRAIFPEAPKANVNGIRKVTFSYVPDGKKHEFRLMLDNPECVFLPDTGERLDAVSADIRGGRITLGFIEPAEFDPMRDFEVEFIKNGISLCSRPDTPAQILKFGICWIDKLPSEYDIQTWLGADIDNLDE